MDKQTVDLKPQFLAWQCLVRQRAMRVGDGRPTTGMCPHLSLADGGSYSGQVTVLIIRTDVAEDVSQFRHMVQKTHDPADRYKAAIKYLSANYYQKPQEFSDEMTGLFSSEGLLARALAPGGPVFLNSASLARAIGYLVRFAKWMRRLTLLKLPTGITGYSIPGCRLTSRFSVSCLTGTEQYSKRFVVVSNSSVYGRHQQDRSALCRDGRR